MRVLQLLPGSVDYPSLRLMASGLRARDVEVSFASLYGTETPTWATAQDIKVIDLGLPVRRRPSTPAAITGLLKREHPDVVHTHLLDASVGTALVSPLTSARVVHTRHHLDEHWLIGTGYHVGLDRLAIRSADRVVAPSEALRDFLVAAEGARRDEVDVVRPCFDFEALTPSAGDRDSARSEFGIDDAFVVGCVSRFIPFKGHDDILAAAEAIVEAIPNLRLLFVGPGTQEHVRAEALRRGLADRLIATGPRSDLARLYAAMDVKVQPSHSENASQVIVEAMIAGTPVIATRVGGATESVGPGAGILVPPRAPAILAAEILRLNEDRMEASRMASTAREHVRMRFDTEAAVGAQVECYHRAVA